MVKVLLSTLVVTTTRLRALRARTIPIPGQSWSVCSYSSTSLLVYPAQRNGSPAAVSGKTTKPENCFAIQLPLRTHAEGDQVQPVSSGTIISTQDCLQSLVPKAYPTVLTK